MLDFFFEINGNISSAMENTANFKTALSSCNFDQGFGQQYLDGLYRQYVN